MHLLVQLSLAALAASAVSADRVLVLGKSPTSIWHETSSSVAFSATGLADLALNSLGLRTGRISSRSAVQSPLQADIFTHSKVYALLLMEDVSTSSLEAVNAALSGVNTFHKLYPAQACNVKVPVAVAQEFQAKYPYASYCAGNTALCASVETSTPMESANLVQQVLADNTFLSSSDERDVVFAKQVAQVMQLTTDMKQHRDGKMLYIVGISSLQGDKQRPAQQVVTTIVIEFLAQLMKKEQVVAGQIMVGQQLPTAVRQVVALTRRVRNRKLVSVLTNKEKPSDEDGKDDEENGAEISGDDDDDDAVDVAASGSMREDDDNSTSTATLSAPGAMSMSDIAEYQIALWTSVLLGVVLLGTVLAMANMDAGRDSLLYAKFIADVNSRKTN